MNYVVSRIFESSLVIWNGFLPKKLIRIFLNGLIGFFLGSKRVSSLGISSWIQASKGDSC